MTEEQAELLANKFGTITGIVLGILITVLFVLAAIYIIVHDIKTSDLRKKYVKSLNEHDTKVIENYNYIQWHLFREKKHDGKTKENTAKQQNQPSNLQNSTNAQPKED